MNSSIRAITNRNREMCLLDSLRADLARATDVRLIVSFLMESGTRALAEDIRQLAGRGVQIRVLTGKYLGITEPSAIYLLKSLIAPAKLEIRIFNRASISFHPKAYFLELPEGPVVYVGSSNLSHSALTTGVEWNLRLPRTTAPEEFDVFIHTFEDLWNNDSHPATDEWLRDYASNWKQTLFNQDTDSTVSSANPGVPRNVVQEPAASFGSNPATPDSSSTQVFPRGAQVEALYYLHQRRMEGVTKGLIVAATGVGKTYLSAFDSIGFRRVLFVAHLEEILLQAAESFRKVRPQAKIGFLTGNRRELDADILFATVQTIGKQETLASYGLRPDSFDYVIVDEFHHAAAETYRRVLEYFKPGFLLGITATPFRMDQQDIFALCDDQVIYEINLKESIAACSVHFNILPCMTKRSTTHQSTFQKESTTRLSWKRLLQKKSEPS